MAGIHACFYLEKPGDANADAALRCCSMLQATWHLDDDAMLESPFVTIYKTQRGCGSDGIGQREETGTKRIAASAITSPARYAAIRLLS